MWKNKNLLILMLGILGAEFGMWFGLIGNLDFLQNTLDSSFLQALILVFGAFIGAVCAPVAGRLIDSRSKRNVLIFASLLRVLAIGTMFIALELNSIYWMLGYSLLMGISSAFYFPAVQSILPLIVKQEELTSANALQMNLMTISRILGAATAGALLVFTTLHILYTLALAAYIVLLGSLYFLKVDEEGTKEINNTQKNMSFRAIFPELQRNQIVIYALILSIIPYLFISGFNLMVIEISNILNDQSIKGTLYAVEGASILLAGILVARLSKNKNIFSLLSLACVLMAAAQLLLIFVEISYISIIAFGLFGFSAGIFLPLSATLYQRTIRTDYLGRFFSFKRVLESVVAQILLVSIGLMIDTIGFEVMIGIFGSISIMIVVATYIINITTNQAENKILSS
ncbi:MFS transporter [Alkalihalophilus marmarensis]|uniref:Major facilitator superfamily (MFS) profile domain-containing protein n=1 Tax=Alkalihalophilus marmarensis DSM 21297 TaxID=1188261 RepID=U6SMD0_9BACI|nr:MFS transporter [Alkalihalophilus marmarensis]ERN52075.1 hypothetical protein A33I_18455 [Alkalihalophilus marmarensis DSM 21297]